MHSPAFVADHGALARSCRCTFRSRRSDSALAESVVDRHLNNRSEPYLSLGTPPAP